MHDPVLFVALAHKRLKVKRADDALHLELLARWERAPRRVRVRELVIGTTAAHSDLLLVVHNNVHVLDIKALKADVAQLGVLIKQKCFFFFIYSSVA